MNSKKSPNSTNCVSNFKYLQRKFNHNFFLRKLSQNFPLRKVKQISFERKSKNPSNIKYSFIMKKPKSIILFVWISINFCKIIEKKKSNKFWRQFQKKICFQFFLEKFQKIDVLVVWEDLKYKYVLVCLGQGNVSSHESIYD